jgi:hypothetical protein
MMKEQRTSRRSKRVKAIKVEPLKFTRVTQDPVTNDMLMLKWCKFNNFAHKQKSPLINKR